MTQLTVLRTICVMRTVVIVATVAMGALRIMWRALRLDPIGSGEEWTADE